MRRNNGFLSFFIFLIFLTYVFYLTYGFFKQRKEVTNDIVSKLKIRKDDFYQDSEKAPIAEGEQIQEVQPEKTEADKKLAEQKAKEETAAKLKADQKQEAEKKLAEQKKLQAKREADAEKKAEAEKARDLLENGDKQWMVQVALAANEANADAVAAQLRAKGYKVTKSPTSKGVRIMVGPSKNREKADAARKKINGDESLNMKSAWVIEWVPLERR